MKNIINLGFCSILFIALLFSCQKVDELNINPNESETVPMNNLLPNVIKDLANEMVSQSFLFSNNAAQLTAKKDNIDVDLYNWDNFSIWEKLYLILLDVNELKKQAVQEKSEAFEGVAIVLRCYIFSILTDMYGPIPYSDALKGASGNVLTPTYDTQQAIYLGGQGLLAELSKAIFLLSNTTSVLDGDILFEGDLVKWKRFASSLSLRLLLRLSKQENVDATISNLLTDLSNLMTSNNDNAELTYLEISPNQYPISRLSTNQFDAVRVSKNLVNLLSTNNDPRLAIYARPSDPTINLPIDSANYTGWENGCGLNGSRLGYSFYDYPGHPTVPNKAKAIFMSYSEVQFLICEAIQRGFASGNAELHYKNGIESSMSYYNVDYARFGWNDFNDFYNNGTSVAYTNDLNQIWTQKWISLFFHGMEPYIEVRRWLDYNNSNWNAFSFLTPPCNNTNSDLFPIRFTYPNTERNANSNNYNTAVSILGGNTKNNRIWLLK